MPVKKSVFKSSTSYFQEKNNIIEQKKQILMEQKRYTIIRERILDDFWFGILRIINHVFNLL